MKKVYEKYDNIYDLLMSCEDTISEKLLKDLSIPYEIFNGILTISKELAASFLGSLCSRKGINQIFVLKDSDTDEILGYSLDQTWIPLLNTEFSYRVHNLVETTSEIIIDEEYIIDSDSIATILLKAVNPLIVDDKECRIGILLINDEFLGTSSKLVVYINDFPVYLPASFYSASTLRYRRSVDNSADALDVLVLKIFDDLRTENLYDRVYAFVCRYEHNKNLRLSYEEFHTLYNTIRKIPTLIDAEYIENPLEKIYEDITHKYPSIDSCKSSYIWRCTASTEFNLNMLIETVIVFLTELQAPIDEYFSIRELLGGYISTKRVVDEIADS